MTSTLPQGSSCSRTTSSNPPEITAAQLQPYHSKNELPHHMLPFTQISMPPGPGLCRQASLDQKLPDDLQPLVDWPKAHADRPNSPCHAQCCYGLPDSDASVLCYCQALTFSSKQKRP